MDTLEMMKEAYETYIKVKATNSEMDYEFITPVGQRNVSPEENDR